MNTHENDPLEQAIADLPWRQPPGVLDARVQQALSRKRFGFAAVVAAACVGLVAGFGVAWGVLPGGGAEPQVAQNNPPAFNEELAYQQTLTYEPVAVGTVRIDGAPPMTLVRQPTIERRAWYDAESGGTYEVTQPQSRYLLVNDGPY